MTSRRQFGFTRRHEELLDGSRADESALSDLLDAARAPGTRDEIAGLPAARTAFMSVPYVRSRPAASVSRLPAVTRTATARLLALKVVAAVSGATLVGGRGLRRDRRRDPRRVVQPAQALDLECRPGTAPARPWWRSLPGCTWPCPARARCATTDRGQSRTNPCISARQSHWAQLLCTRRAQPAGHAQQRQQLDVPHPDAHVAPAEPAQHEAAPPAEPVQHEAAPPARPEQPDPEGKLARASNRTGTKPRHSPLRAGPLPWLATLRPFWDRDTTGAGDPSGARCDFTDYIWMLWGLRR